LVGPWRRFPHQTDLPEDRERKSDNQPIQIPLSFEVATQMSNKKKVGNVFEAILRYGHDEDFFPEGGDDFIPTNAPAGSEEKIEVLRRRVELGQPLWHMEDRKDYTGLTGAVRPRE
jgi:hypothetical protein